MLWLRNYNDSLNFKELSILVHKWMVYFASCNLVIFNIHRGNNFQVLASSLKSLRDKSSNLDIFQSYNWSNIGDITDRLKKFLTISMSRQFCKVENHVVLKILSILLGICSRYTIVDFCLALKYYSLLHKLPELILMKTK